MNDVTDPNEIELNKQLPAELGGFTDRELQSMVLPLRIWFDPRIVRTIERLAQSMARSDVAVPKHLRGKPFACASVIRSAMIWRLNPDGVAASTFETPGGTIGYMGRLCNAIIQASGHLTPGEAPRFEHIGDWKRVSRKFRMEKSTKKFDEHSRPQEYPVRMWTDKDAEDLGVFVHIPLKDRDAPLVFPDGEPFWLSQAFPLFSTLWATDPRTQICYLVIRRAINVVLPGLMLGVPFDDDAYGSEIRDITAESQALEAATPAEKTSVLSPQIRRQHAQAAPGEARAVSEPPDTGKPGARAVEAPSAQETVSEPEPEPKLKPLTGRPPSDITLNQYHDELLTSVKAANDEAALNDILTDRRFRWLERLKPELAREVNDAADARYQELPEFSDSADTDANDESSGSDSDTDEGWYRTIHTAQGQPYGPTFPPPEWLRRFEIDYNAADEVGRDRLLYFNRGPLNELAERPHFAERVAALRGDTNLSPKAR